MNLTRKYNRVNNFKNLYAQPNENYGSLPDIKYRPYYYKEKERERNKIIPKREQSAGNSQPSSVIDNYLNQDKNLIYPKDPYQSTLDVYWILL